MKPLVVYAIKDPVYWKYKQPIPVPSLSCWLRVGRDDTQAPPYVIERHPWRDETPPDSILWEPYRADDPYVGRFPSFEHALAWLCGCLHGVARLTEFAPTANRILAHEVLLQSAVELVVRRLQAPLPTCTCRNCIVDFPRIQLVEGWNCGTCRSNHDPHHPCCPRAIAVAGIIRDATALIPT